MVVASLDGGKLGTPANQFPSLPLTLTPKSAKSKISFQFLADIKEDPIVEVVVPISRLIDFGAPLFTSVWLGLNPSQGSMSFDDALKCSSNHSAPKVHITLLHASAHTPLSSRPLKSLVPAKGQLELEFPDTDR